ncbi:LacI family DNA-binding transcriptional regulator [Halobacillus sp. ACCC02827]|uniref:LacI family DNA-binding transcriptional regulator n=1 Tax=Bacillaceae TaxID=186817 RepID=UPI0002A51D12|nr:MULTISPECIES: LacI family DNA-binding transcriptional regulator [Bacillaceae]ELK47774.1 LacI family transcriptional regulator [Halobacillus sp. BAB-2008]QHT45458.1 LacI family transcriptional regulator [Bacillus sp. SB49]WJE16254.1 LacI family DNA-binding transcriptional regulator [Halobacillus sp. ACCC02827]
MATIKDVAKLAGVAVSTVSYALNDSNKISLETKRRVKEAASALNYQKNGIASDLKKHRTNTIALILSDLSGPYYSELIKGVQDVAVSNGYDLIACSSVGGKESTAVKFLREKRVDGAIILAHNIDDDIAVEAAREGFPLVVLDRKLNNDNIYHVEVDNEHGGFIATEYLIKYGFKKIGYVSGPSNSYDNKRRLEGFKKALDMHNIVFQSKWKVSGDFTREGGYRAAKLLIAQQEMPEAVFFANDEMAIGGLKAFEEYGIKVPEDISIIGFDDIQISEFVSPPLTTVSQPKYEVGALAVHIIFQALQNQDVDSKYTLHTKLVQRNSVKLK